MVTMLPVDSQGKQAQEAINGERGRGREINNTQPGYHKVRDKGFSVTGAMFNHQFHCSPFTGSGGRVMLFTRLLNTLRGMRTRR